MPPRAFARVLRAFAYVAVAATGVFQSPGPLLAQETHPLRFEGARGAFVVVDPPAAAWAASDSAFEAVMFRCGRVRGMASTDIESLAQLPPLDVARGVRDSTAHFVSFFTMPRAMYPSECFTRFGQDYIAALRGVRFTMDTLPQPTLHPYGIALVRGDSVLGGQDVATAPSWHVTPRRVRREPVGLVRSSIPLDSLAPLSTGFSTALGIAVFYGFDSVAVVAPVPEDVLLALWTRALPERFAQATTSPAVGAFAPTPWRNPRNRELREARDLAAEGKPATSAAVALEVLEAGRRLSKRDRQLGYLQLGELAVRHADTSAARTAFAQAQRTACVFLPAGTAQEVAEVALPILRQDRRCEARPLLAAAALGALRPGFGAPRGTRRPYVGLLLSAAILASGLNTMQTLDDARARYDAYETFIPVGVDSATADALVDAAYRDAERTRLRALSAARLTVALWSLGALDGVLEELWRRRQLRRWESGASDAERVSEARRLRVHVGNQRLALRWEFR